MSFSLDDLAMRRPANGTGVQIAPALWIAGVSRADIDQAGASLWFAVEMACPSGDTAAVWGEFQWGVGEWSQIDWTDLTSRMQGLEFERGGEADALARSDVGELTLTLDNSDNRLSVTSATPIAPVNYMGAGSLVRAGIYQPTPDPQASGDPWTPLITTVVESWTELVAGTNPIGEPVGRRVEIVGVETISLLARVDNFAAVAAGSGDTPWQRLQRILDAAGFPFALVGYLSATPAAIGYQATTLAGPALNEAYLAADSIDADLRSTRQGRLGLFDKGYTWSTVRGRPLVLSDARGELAGDEHVDYDAASMRTTNDDAVIVNEVNLACVGGTEITDSDSVSIDRYQRRTYTRNDLAYRTADQATAAAWISSRTLARGAASYRPLGCTIDASKSLSHLLAAALPDVGERINVRTPDAEFTDATIASYRHYIKPKPGGIHWLVDLEFGVSTLYEWESRHG